MSQERKMIPFYVPFETPISASTTATSTEIDLSPFIPERFWKTPFTAQSLTLPGIQCTLHSMGVNLSHISGASTINMAMAMNSDGLLIMPVAAGSISLNVGSAAEGSAVVSQYPVTTFALGTEDHTFYLRLQTSAGTCDVNFLYGCLELHGL